MGILVGFLAATVRIATPLLLAATGELVVERAGVISLAIEGAMLAGALGSALGASVGGPQSVWVGVLGGIAAGALVAAVFAAVAIGARSDQIIAGTALTLASVGVTGTVFRRAFGAAGPGLSLPTLGPLWLGQPAPTYVAVLLLPLVWWLLFRTTWGLQLRATGESLEAARAHGVSVGWMQTTAVLIGGALAGLGGATLVLAQVGTFAERMTAGRGFIAIAIVVLGRWHPFGVLTAALLFGGASALQFAFQAMGVGLPYQLFLMLPYLLALAALASGVGRTRAPAGLGRVIER